MTRTHRHLGTAPRVARGFSFLEIMLVVLIIGIMTAIIGPKLAGKSDKARRVATIQQIDNIKTALQMFEMNVGRYPTTEEGIEALVRRPSGISEADWEQALEEIPLDGWKREFEYRCPGESGRDYDLVSKGSDENDPSDDITNAPRRTADD